MDSESFVVASCLNSGGNNGGFRTEPGEHLVAHTLRAEGHDASEDGTDALTSSDGGTHADSKPHIAGGNVVRRLMPIECERLQGLPDDWTRYDAAGNELSDSARYRMLGNAVTKNVAEWIGRRILASTEANP